MIKKLVLLGLLMPLQLLAQQLSVGTVQCEYKANPLGVEAPSPKLSWQLKSGSRNVLQTAYRV